jgi:phospholipid/cholesterol/gamma-HCH transport system permease protein
VIASIFYLLGQETGGNFIEFIHVFLSDVSPCGCHRCHRLGATVGVLAHSGYAARLARRFNVGACTSEQVSPLCGEASHAVEAIAARLDGRARRSYAFHVAISESQVSETPSQVVEQPVSPAETPSVYEVLVDASKQSVYKVQEYSKLSWRSLTNIASGPRYWNDTVVQMDDVGVGSLPIVLLSGFFIGAVMVLQTGAQFERFGQSSLTGDVVSLALVRELGPSITGLLVAGRCASGIASELGSMQVTEQVDAMRAMGTDPSRKLVTPRVLATLLTLPLLTTVSVFVGLIGGMVASVFSLRLNAFTFWQRAIAILHVSDLMQGLSKSVVYGFILATVGCYQGLNVRGGTQGVGRATTQAVVVSSVMIIVADTFLTKLALYLADKFF